MSERDKYLTKAEQHTLRDKFLTESLGECWHVFFKHARCWPPIFECSKCGIEVGDTDYFKEYFSTWEGFGKLWEWAQKQEWWSQDWKNRLSNVDVYINPDRFADAVYKFLKKEDGDE